MKILPLLIFVLSFLTGCTNTFQNVAGPEINKNPEPDWILLPASDEGFFQTEAVVTGEVNGEEGGKLQINEIYQGGPFSTVRLGVKMTFPKNCFKGIETITMKVDMMHGTVTYSPPMQFDIPALLDLDFQGIDLTGIDSGNIYFVYHNPDGKHDKMEAGSITVNQINGRISLKDGKVPHFSRYGFSR